MVPTAPDASCESKLSVSARALKDLLDHFPIARGPKSDPQLVWGFSDDEVILKGLDSSLDTSGKLCFLCLVCAACSEARIVKGQLSTELSISSAEFEVYDVYEPPITIAFHLREFLVCFHHLTAAPAESEAMQATIGFAESLALPLDMRFTDPAAPLFIEVEGDISETLFVISTSQVHGTDAPLGHAENMQPRGKKRERESAEPHQPNGNGAARSSSTSSGLVAPNSARKKPMKVVVRADRESVARDGQESRRDTSLLESMPPPSLPYAPSNLFAPRASFAGPVSPPPATPLPPVSQREPLFFPGSQLSQAAEAALRESGLGIENMDAEEFAAMMDDEGEEVGVVQPEPQPMAEQGDADMDEERDELDDDEVMRESSFDLYDDGETQLGPTQGDTSSKVRIFMWTTYIN